MMMMMMMMKIIFVLSICPPCWNALSLGETEVKMVAHQIGTVKSPEKQRRRTFLTDYLKLFSELTLATYYVYELI